MPLTSSYACWFVPLFPKSISTDDGHIHHTDHLNLYAIDTEQNIHSPKLWFNFQMMRYVCEIPPTG